MEGQADQTPPPSKDMESLSIDPQSETGSSLSSSASTQMTPEERFRILRSLGEECVQEDELLNLLTKKLEPICYDSFVPSGRMHIAQGIMKTINVNKLTSAGCKVKIWIADWLAHLNNKMDGDLKKIQTIGRYLIEVWKAVGMDLNDNKVEFLWSSEEIHLRSDEYWPIVMDIARRNELSRITGFSKIKFRIEQDELMAAHVLYPCMQCADTIFLKADISQHGMDQKEVNVLAREYCDHINRTNKPVALFNRMLPGLQQGQKKMSTNEPSSCIFMDDEEAEVNLKIKKAYCPPKIVEGNPCLEYIKYTILPWFNEFKVVRSPENGSDKTFKSFDELEVDYVSGDLHPGDLKTALAKSLNKILQPVRDHFKNDANARDLLRRVKALLKRVKTPPSKDVESLSIGSQSERGLSSSSSASNLERFRIVRSIGEECIRDDELLNLLTKKPVPICYDGFEPSGRMHIAQGVMKAIIVNKLTSAGCNMKIWIADWFAQLNNKMGGDLEKIQTVGRYLIEIWKAIGMNLGDSKVEFLWSSEEINLRPNEYWPVVMDIARRNTLSRMIRCLGIMGRSELDDLTAAQILYPCMQCADIFFLKADICQLGMDQRKVNVLAREYCDDIKRKNKPIILSHHMLPGLQQGQEKMSKSNPSSSIFMEDEEEDVNRKINEAYCPPKVIGGNPCLEYIKYIILPWFNEFKVKRTPDDGGDKTFKSFDELVVDYESGDLHPGDLKTALAKSLNEILQPVRDHFINDANARDLLERVKSFRVTR